MKYMNIPAALLFLFLLIVLPSNAPGSQNDKAVFTQNPPQAMVLVETDSLLPFYISAIEEPNINWQIYLGWLKNVFVSYPQVWKEAMPTDTSTGMWLQYNDPVLESHFEHPAFQWYPVTGVSWLQVQSYLEWKTDRLNEAILIRTGAYSLQMRSVVDENNFNTEAYLCNQYEPYKNKAENLPRLMDSKHGRRNFEVRDGLFFPQYRLPTEDEWEAARRYASDPVNRALFQDAISKDCFLEPWAEYMGMQTDGADGARKSKVDFGRNYTYGVAEWLLNLEGVMGGYRISDAELLQRNGWLNFESSSPYDPYGEIEEKDSLGRLPFRFVQVSGINKPLYLTPPVLYRYRWETVVARNPHFKDSAYTDSFLNAEYGNIYQLLKNRGFQPDWNGFLAQRGIYAASLGADSLKYSYKRILVSDNSQLKRRFVASSYADPNAGKSSALQSSASAGRGFRCVLPFTGAAVLKRYRVKW